MNINIQTRFSIGDEVWVPGLYYEWYPIKEEYEVDSIEIQIDSKSQRIFYLIKNKTGDSCRYPEKLCFDSYEECQRWCVVEK